MNPDRAALFRKHALDAESKAFRAQSESSRRAWMIVARDWIRMAEREELKYLDASETRLAPEPSNPEPAPEREAPTLAPDQVGELEDAIRQLAASRARP